MDQDAGQCARTDPKLVGLLLQCGVVGLVKANGDGLGHGSTLAAERQNDAFRIASEPSPFTCTRPYLFSNAVAPSVVAGSLVALDRVADGAEQRARLWRNARDFRERMEAVGAENLPSKDWDRNSAWLQLAALAASLNAWLRHLALDGQLAAAEPKALRFRLLGAPARHVTHARKRILKIPPGWAWATDLVTAWDRLQALHPA